MNISPKYENYEYTARGARIRSQSIVECRLSDWSQNKILAVSPTVVADGAEVLSGEVRYGGKLYFLTAPNAKAPPPHRRQTCPSPWKRGKSVRTARVSSSPPS